MAKQSKQEIIENLPTLESMETGSNLLENLEDDDTPDEVVEEQEEEKPKDKPEDKKKDKEKETDDPPEEDEVLTEEEEKQIFETLKDKDPKDFNEAEKEIFDKHNTPEEEGSFWEDVEAITGNKIDLDYGETDPETPEGAALRESALIAKAQEEQLKYLETTYPEAFKILQYYADGGSIQDLVSPNEVDYSVVEIKEENTDQQKKFLLDYYTNVIGVSEAKANKMIEFDEESDEGLYKTAKEALDGLKEEQETKKAEKLEEQRQIAEAERERDRQFIGIIREITDAGEIGDFKVPTTEREEFNKAVMQRLQRDGNGGYVYNVPITDKTIQQVLQEAYFGFKKGDLKSLITKQAKTENVKRLKRKAVEDQKKILKSTLTRNKDVKGLPTFSEVTIE